MEALSTWKVRGLFKADAQKCADEISSIEEATPQNIVEYAKDESTELHKCFTWDNDVAADKWRLQEARQVVCNLVIKRPDDKPSEIRTFFSLTRETGARTYQPTRLIVRNEDAYEKLLAQAKAELRSFKQKYHNLSELEEILELID